MSLNIAVMPGDGIGREKWIPKSQMEDWPDANKNGDIWVSDWFAMKAELI